MHGLTERAERLDAYLAENDLRAVWFARPNSFAWLTGGSNVVDRDAPVGVAAAGYVRDGDGNGDGGPSDGEFRVATDNIEADRLADEELPEAFSVARADWYDASLGEVVAERTPTPAAADFDAPGLDRVDASPLRRPLAAPDIERYRALGEETAAALEAVCREADPGDTEREVAAALRAALTARGIEAPVALVGGGERARTYRHYTPQDEPLGEYALVSVTAQREGLYASATRTVAFDPPAWLEARHRKAVRVEAAALAATRRAAREGGTAADVFGAIRDAYAAVDYEGEWRNHHQGGAAGYAGREWIATPDLDEPVEAPMAYAWNPTVQGAKSEDTFLVTDDGFEALTATGDWPTATVDAPDGEATVERHAILER